MKLLKSVYNTCQEVKRNHKDKIKKFFQWGLENCIHCGSYIVGEALLCPYCEEQLFKVSNTAGLFNHRVENINCWSLFEWEKDKNKILNKLILNLKGQKQIRSWRYLARIMSHELAMVLELNKIDKIIVVPCPNPKGAKDHAFLFASQLSHHLKCQLVKSIVVKNYKEMKTLSKEQRREQMSQKFLINASEFEKITETPQTTILFVDDVITTGTTLLAAWQLHKKFKEFIGISLAFRR